MRLLLLSNSTMAGQPYLDYPKYDIRDFLGAKPMTALFFPYAAVTFSWDDYEARVKARFNEIGHDVISIHRFQDPVRAVADAEALGVGGGNTWNLLRNIHDHGLIEPPVGFEVNILDTGVELQLGVFQIPAHPVVFLPDPLAFHNETEPFGKGEAVYIRLVDLIGKSLGHPGQLHRVELIDRLLIKHGTPPESDNNLFPGDSHEGSGFPQ